MLGYVIDEEIEKKKYPIGDWSNSREPGWLVQEYIGACVCMFFIPVCLHYSYDLIINHTQDFYRLFSMYLSTIVE